MVLNQWRGACDLIVPWLLCYAPGLFLHQHQHGRGIKTLALICLWYRPTTWPCVSGKIITFIYDNIYCCIFVSDMPDREEWLAKKDNGSLAFTNHDRVCCKVLFHVKIVAKHQLSVGWNVRLKNHYHNWTIPSFPRIYCKFSFNWIWWLINYKNNPL